MDNEPPLNALPKRRNQHLPCRMCVIPGSLLGHLLKQNVLSSPRTYHPRTHSSILFHGTFRQSHRGLLSQAL